ncbi:MAG: cysteine desulfurase family protein [Patescibacteria group bacterium]
MFKKGNKRIYLDFAAATPVRKEVKKAMNQYWDKDFGNPGGLHQEGQIAKKAVSDARQKIADLLGTRNDEIIFNSGGTESNNAAIWGVISKLEEEGTNIKDMHFITSKMEHPSVLNYFQHFEKRGAKLDLVETDKNGQVDLNSLKELLRPNTILVSVMYVNNEIGTIQPIKEIIKIIRAYKKKELKNSEAQFPLFHTDGAQALLYVSIDAGKLGADLISFDSQKIYGPKGMGLLYVRKGIKINPLISGGNQENSLRSGTENVPLIVGFAKALELATRERDAETERLIKLRNYFLEEIIKKIPQVKLNGNLENRLPNNLNLYIPANGNEFSTIQLDAMGIACGTKSACSKEKYSYVLKSLGKSDEEIKNSLRFTLGRTTTKKEIDRAIKAIEEIVKIANQS